MKAARVFCTLILSFVAFGCSPTAATPTLRPSPTPVPASPTPMPPLTVCLVTDVGLITDGGFNQYAYEGMLEAINDYGLNPAIYFESHEETDYEPNVNSCIESNADVVITVGFLIQSVAVAAATAHPEIYFIGIDQDTSGLAEPLPNYVGVQFREDEAGFLAGVMAALMANELGSSTIAGIYGIDFPALKRFRTGFEQGALYINPDWELGVNILGAYHDSFVDTEAGIATSQGFIDAGASVIFGAAGPLGYAGIRHAAQAGVYVVGVDQDEFYTTFQSGEVAGSEFLISSVLKRVDQGVYDMIEALADHDDSDFPKSANYVLGAARGGIGFSPAHSDTIPRSIHTRTSEVLQLLIRGEIETGVDLTTGELLASD